MVSENTANNRLGSANYEGGFDTLTTEQVKTYLKKIPAADWPKKDSQYDELVKHAISLSKIDPRKLLKIKSNAQNLVDDKIARYIAEHHVSSCDCVDVPAMVETIKRQMTNQSEGLSRI